MSEWTLLKGGGTRCGLFVWLERHNATTHPCLHATHKSYFFVSLQVSVCVTFVSFEPVSTHTRLCTHWHLSCWSRVLGSPFACRTAHPSFFSFSFNMILQNSGPMTRRAHTTLFFGTRSWFSALGFLRPVSPSPRLVGSERWNRTRQFERRRCNFVAAE